VVRLIFGVVHVLFRLVSSRFGSFSLGSSGYVLESRCCMLCGVVCLPLSESVTFKAVLQRQGRVQVPRLVRWRYKLEPDEVFTVTLSREGFFKSERYAGRMRKDGRLTIPKLTLKLLAGDEEEKLEGCVLEVTLEPAEEQTEKKS